MDLTQVSCNGCGAALQIPANARFVTCRYCGANLEIKHTDSAVYTETLNRIDQRTAEMAEDLGAIRRAQEIERLDREWALERNGFMTRDKQGNLREPSATAGMLGAFIGGAFGLLWTIMACAITGSAPAQGPFIIAKVIFPLFGIVFTVGAIMTGVKSSGSAAQFREAEQRYQQRRADLMSPRADSSGAAPPELSPEVAPQRS